MRTSFLILLMVVMGCCTLVAQERGVKSKVTLKVGDVPPSLQATKWLTGTGVKTFEPGKVYVIEFWATWCGPCIAMMPHLGDLQEHLGSKGTIIGFSAADPNNSVEQITKFVEKRRGKLGYTIAYADNRDTYEAYMTAAGQSGIPCSYVIGKDGKLAFIGHPLFVEYVLPQVLDGTWDPIQGPQTLAEADKKWDTTYAAINKPGDTKAQLADWDEFHAKWPKLATDPYMNEARLKLLMTAKKFAEAETLANSMLSQAIKRNDTFGLRSVVSALNFEQATTQPELVALGVRAADAGLEIDGETSAALIRVVKAYSAAGNVAKVKEYGPKAVEAAEKELTDDTDPTGILRVAAAHFAVGNIAKAKEFAEKALSKVDASNAGLKRYVEEQAKKYGFESKESKDKK